MDRLHHGMHTGFVVLINDPYQASRRKDSSIFIARLTLILCVIDY